MELSAFRNKIFDEALLRAYGFREEAGAFSHTVPIRNGEFLLTVTVAGQDVRTRLVDSDTGEEYRLHLVEEAEGEFVGSVREEFGRVLEEIARACCRTRVFSGGEAQRLLAYAKEKYGTDPEFLWSDLPEAAVLRRKDTGKWYALFMKLPKKRLSLSGEGQVEVLNLRYPVFSSPETLDGVRILPAYHMNKKHWMTILLGGESDSLLPLLDDSYKNAR